jgi:putative peptidoglycan lipid II flippase
MADDDISAPPSPDAPEQESAAGTVAVGILSSRIVGLLRERVLAYFFGVGAHADVVQFAFRAPNLLQNLLGEGTISAAFIPIYSRMIENDRPRDAGRFAGAIFGLLLAAAAGVALLGIVAAEPIVTVLAYGWIDDAALVEQGELPINRFELAVNVVRITFPMAGLLVLAAWALGVLNSHRRFFVPYVAPVLWNIAIISGVAAGAYLYVGTPWALTPETLSALTLERLVFAACFGALAGGVLQFLVQLPVVVRAMPSFRFSLSTRVEGVQEAFRAFGPVVAGRGVAQISGYIDTFLAALLAAGALSALRFGLLFYMLPISLFGMSVAASELPELSRLTGDRVQSFLARVRRSLRQILFLTVPTVIGYLTFGFLIVGALLRTGSFNVNSNWLVYLVLGTYSLGLLATTMSRLLQNVFYALGDTKTPAWIAVLRVTVSAALAVPLMFWLDQFALAEVVGLSPADQPLFLGALGLGLGASGGAWVELWRLRAALRAHMTGFALPWGRLVKMMGLALAAAVPTAALWWWLPSWPVAATAALIVSTYAGLYLGSAYLAGFDELDAWAGRFLDRGAE